MKISLSPQLSAAPLAVSVAGDTITINDSEYDFGPLTEGATLPRDAVDCAWLASDVTRIEGQITLTLILPHGPDAPEETRFPAPIITAGDGPVALPAYSIEGAS